MNQCHASTENHRAIYARQAAYRREKAARENRRMACLFTAMLVIALFVYIGRMANISMNAKQISTMDKEISALTGTIQCKQLQLAEYKDMERVRDVAMNTLGMVEPGTNQVQVVSLNISTVGEGIYTAYDTGDANDGSVE